VVEYCLLSLVKVWLQLMKMLLGRDHGRPWHSSVPLAPIPLVVYHVTVYILHPSPPQWAGSILLLRFNKLKPATASPVYRG
jgi:hypothetical protein